MNLYQLDNLYPLNIKQKQIIQIIAKILRCYHPQHFCKFKIHKFFDLFDMDIWCFIF